MTGTKEFLWMVGEESSDPVVAWQGARVRVDQMASTGHRARQADDLADVAATGVRLVRYGINWRLAEPERGSFDWSGWDEAFRLFEANGLEMVADFLHFGTPDWLGPMGGAELPGALLAYCEAFLARYPQVRWFTPVNEPYITALLSARWGAWNERATGDEPFVQTLATLCLADLQCMQAIRADRGDARFMNSEAFGWESPPDDTDEARRHADYENALRLLTFDLRYGVAPSEVVEPILSKVADQVRERIDDLASIERVVAGHDFYPVSVNPMGAKRYRDLAAAFDDRYRVPFVISETSNLGHPPAHGPTWLAELIDDVAALRSEGRPCVGLCWYSRGDQHDWDTMLVKPRRRVTEVGLFDMDRRPRPVHAAFAAAVRAGAPGGR